MKTVEEIYKLAEAYEKQMRKEGALEINNPKVKFNTNSLREFLIDFFYHNHLSHADSKVDGWQVGARSFTQTQVVGSKTSQCYAGARRTIGDLFRLAINYVNPDIKLTDVMMEVMKILNDKVPITTKDGRNTQYMYTNVCGTIRRRVFNASSANKNSTGFHTDNSTFHYDSNTSSNEFPIVMQDYLTLHSHIYDAAARKAAEEEAIRKAEAKAKREAELKLQQEMKSKSLDELVAAKLASILSNDKDERRALVRKVQATKKVLKRA